MSHAESSTQQLDKQNSKPNKRRGRKFLVSATAVGAAAATAAVAVGVGHELGQHKSGNNFSTSLEFALKGPLESTGADLRHLDTSAESLLTKPDGSSTGKFSFIRLKQPRFAQLDGATQKAAEQLPNPWQVATFRNQAEVLALTAILNGYFGNQSPYNTDQTQGNWTTLKRYLEAANEEFLEKGHGDNTAVASPANNQEWGHHLEAADAYYQQVIELAGNTIDAAVRENPDRPLLIPAGMVEQTT